VLRCAWQVRLLASPLALAEPPRSIEAGAITCSNEIYSPLSSERSLERASLSVAATRIGGDPVPTRRSDQTMAWQLIFEYRRQPHL
jgi:hypothetical protein